MENLVQKWTDTTAKIYQGVLFYTIAKLLYGLFDSINDLVSGVGNLMSLAERGTFDMSIGFWDVVCWLCLAGLIYGYYLFLTNLSVFRTIVSPEDSKAVGNIRTAVILGIVAAALYFIPLLGWVGWILDIISIVLMLMGYSALKNSLTFPAKAKEGASKLFTAMILNIVAAILSWIPLVGWIFALVLNIVAFFMILSGWAAIKNSRPHIQKEEIEIEIIEVG